MRKQVVVAIPARNEAERIAKCLAAFARQSVPADHLVLLLNNCTDDTAEVVKASPKSSHRLHVIEDTLPGSTASAGVARGLAMIYSASLIDDGVILTTDADGEVSEDWIEANLKAIEDGADAVCGRAAIDPIDALLIPRHLHEDDAREVAYGRLLDEIESVILPDSTDPWPRHTEESGASIAITASMFRHVGGVPCVPSGEDRALLRKLRLIDARIRHDPNITVTVSGRIEGRAQGGMADTIRRRIGHQDEYADERIEPALVALQRLRMKQRFSLLRDETTGLRLNELATALAVTPNAVADAIAAPYFGLGWCLLAETSPILQRRRVAFLNLPRETATARSILRSVVSEKQLAEPCDPVLAMR